MFINILNQQEFNMFKNYQSTVNILHLNSTKNTRNLEIFEEYFKLLYDKYSKYGICTTIGNKYNITKQRVSDIINKYLIHFILYLHYNLDYDYNNDLICVCKQLLPKEPKLRLEQYILDGKPFKELSKRDLYFFKYNIIKE